MIDPTIRALWSAPDSVHARSTTRVGPGRSLPPFDIFNLGDHVGDDAGIVAHNRAALHEQLALPGTPVWLQQVHGSVVVDADAQAAIRPGLAAPTGDALVTRARGRVLAILTADCLPVVFSADDGSVVAAAHAGWRGLASGVLEATVAAMRHPSARIAAWIGPCIRQPAFEVGREVRDTFVARDARAISAFTDSPRAGHFLCDLPLLARQRLERAGVSEVADCGLCTHADAGRFYSHRRAQPTGRHATLIWRD